MKKNFLSIVILVSIVNSTIAQSAGIGTTAPDASAVLELKATNKGFLPPGMTASQKGSILSPKAGLLVYQTDATAGLYVYNSTAWVAVAGGGATGTGWSVTGNAGTNAATNFIGTTNAKPLTFKTNGAYSGQISNNGMVALGTGAAPVLSDACIVAIGKNALLNNGAGGTSGAKGLVNTAAGSEALKANSTGLYNTGLGFNSLVANTAGQGNAATGTSALPSNISGDDKTSVGNQSLFNNQSGYSNTATGVSALYPNKTRKNEKNNSNCFMGFDCNSKYAIHRL